MLIILISDCVPNMRSLLSLQQPLHYNNCSRILSYSHYIFIHRYFIHCFQSSEFVYHILYFLSFFCIVLNKRRFRPNNLSGSVLFLKIAAHRNVNGGYNWNLQQGGHFADTFKNCQHLCQCWGVGLCKWKYFLFKILKHCCHR